MVDASGELTSGQKFENIKVMKQLILSDQRQVARNLARQFLVYATGAPVRFGDRPELEALLDKAQASDYSVRDIIHQVIQSDLFLTK